MRGALAIAARDLRVLFYAPAAWALLAVVMAIMGYLFLTQLEVYAQVQSQLLGMPDPPGLTEVMASSLYGSAGIVLLMIVPLLTMRAFAEERRAQTLALLLAAPVSMTGIVIGKFLAVAGFLALVAALVLAMPLSLAPGASLDYGLLGAATLGLVLLLASFAALGVFVSSLTAQPIVAAGISFGALLGLWILNWAGSSGGGGSAEVLRYLSILSHYDPLLKGVFDTADVAYFVLFIGTFLALAVRRLDGERIGG
jgi:ABC-2 type transport system permease protein